jgi:hypothetical protein
MTPSNPPERTLQYRYAFYFPDGTLKAFIVTLLHDTLAIVAPERNEHQAWTALDHKQCHNCHLDPALFFDKTFLFYNGSIRREILCVKWIVAATYWVITYYWMRVVAQRTSF